MSDNNKRDYWNFCIKLLTVRGDKSYAYFLQCAIPPPPLPLITFQSHASCNNLIYFPSHMTDFSTIFNNSYLIFDVVTFFHIFPRYTALCLYLLLIFSLNNLAVTYKNIKTNIIACGGLLVTCCNAVPLNSFDFVTYLINCSDLWGEKVHCMVTVDYPFKHVLAANGGEK